jgi:tetraacyldisaccharide 4'-kinase
MIDKLILFPYYLILSVRHALFNKGFLFKSREAEVPTVCIGNITVGGTGKTPHTEMLLRMLQRSDDWGFRNVAVLSRGYKRKSRHFQQVLRGDSATQYGDEPVQIKKKFPAVTVAVDKDRIEGCEFLCHPELLQTSKKARKCVHKEMEQAELIVLDDAFQYRRLKAAYNIVLVDYNRPLNKDMLLPLGRLRDLPSRLRAADAVIITKCPHYMEDDEKAEFLADLGYRDYDPALCEAVNKKGGKQKVYLTCINYQPLEPIYEESDTRYIYAKKLVLFTGIAKDTPLRMFLSDKYKIVKHLSFSDHHNYSKADIRTFEAVSRAFPTAAIATTEKDAQRLLDCPKVTPRLKERLFQVPIQVAFLSELEEAVFSSSLIEHLRQYQQQNNVE